MQRIESWAPKDKPLNGWQREESQYANIDGLYLSQLSNSNILTKGTDLHFFLFKVEMEYLKNNTYKRNRRWSVLEMKVNTNKYKTPPKILITCSCSNTEHRLQSASRLLKEQGVVLPPLYTVSATKNCRRLHCIKLRQVPFSPLLHVWLVCYFRCLPCFPDSHSLAWFFGGAHCSAACGKAVQIPKSSKARPRAVRQARCVIGLTIWASQRLINDRLRFSALWQRRYLSPVNRNRILQSSPDACTLFALGKHWGVCNKNTFLHLCLSWDQCFHYAGKQ